MTQDLLESDIELAKTLMGAGHLDSEIVAALSRRGLDPARAAHLVSDLRQGRPIIQAMSLMARRAGRSDPSQGQEETDSENGASRETARSRRDRPRSSTGPVFIGVVIGVLGTVLAFGLYTYLHGAAGTEVLPVAARSLSTAAASTTPEANTLRTSQPQGSPCNLELGPDGLRMCDALVTRGNALSTLSSCLGTPTRTNRVAEAGQMIYAYDRHGVLIYKQTDGSETSLIIDFQARGGDHCAKIPFSGSFKIGGTAIEAKTDPKTLAAIPGLEMTDAGSEGGLRGAKFKNLEVFFAYRSTPDRLSLVQINLR